MFLQLLWLDIHIVKDLRRIAVGKFKNNKKNQTKKTWMFGARI